MENPHQPSFGPTLVIVSTLQFRDTGLQDILRSGSMATEGVSIYIDCCPFTWARHGGKEAGGQNLIILFQKAVGTSVEQPDLQ